jgi:hypothetical protein
MTRSRDVADTQDNLGGAVAPWVGGKNAIINGGFDIWQRGTSAAMGSVGVVTSADRWATYSSPVGTMSRQLTNDTTNLPFIQYCARVQRNAGDTAANIMTVGQSFETINSIQFAGKTVTLSFYARKGANYSSASDALSAFARTGTGTDQNLISTGYTGSSGFSGSVTLTSTWQRFTITGTFATNITEAGVEFRYTTTGTAGANDYFEVTGVQLEMGSQATPFARAGGSIGGELALCQRYCYKATVTQTSGIFGLGFFTGSTNCTHLVPFPVTMRTSPSMVASGTFTSENTAFYTSTTLALAANTASPDKARVSHTVTGATALQPAMLSASNDANAYLLFTSEL